MATLEEQVTYLMEWYEADTAFHSYVAYDHAAMVLLTGLPPEAASYILRKMQFRWTGVHWFYVLAMITGIDAGAGETTVMGAQNKWLAWGKAKGLI